MVKNYRNNATKFKILLSHVIWCSPISKQKFCLLPRVATFWYGSSLHSSIALGRSNRSSSRWLPGACRCCRRTARRDISPIFHPEMAKIHTVVKSRQPCRCCYFQGAFFTNIFFLQQQLPCDLGPGLELKWWHVYWPYYAFLYGWRLWLRSTLHMTMQCYWTSFRRKRRWTTS